MADLQYIVAPQEAAGDDHVRIVEWLVPDGTMVAAGTPVALAETTKAAFEIAATSSGYVFHLARVDDRVKVGGRLAVVSTDNARPAEAQSRTEASAQAAAGSEQTFTRKALALMEEHGLPASAFAGKSVVRHTDVEEFLKARTSDAGPKKRRFAGEDLNPGEDWDAVLNSEEWAAMQALYTKLRRRLKARFNRHVPLGTLLHDRWAVAREYGFGEGTSVYDECLILGDVTVGRNCWVGPFTVLDGNFAALRIGDNTSIGSGSHIYSHHAIDNVITEGATPIHAADTTIGNACFVSPLSMIGPGSRIGDHSFIASGSFVQGVFPEYSYIAGSPARRVGRVEVRNNRVLLLKDE